jgi:CRISPR-associated protein (TIGR02584 family)
VTGLSPQVVTETLYALAVRLPAGRTPFVPSEIHLITTRQGAEHARLNLLSDKIGWFHRLRRDYNLPQIVFDASCIHVLPDLGGTPLEDIRTPADNEQAADFITEKVREFTGDSTSALHVSIAGGRKTMGYYLGYALSLFGREQDRLSHVLVSAPYESNREFYYPTPEEYPVHVKQGDREITYDARDAEVVLAEIPFVRLREGLPERLRRGQASFLQVVAAASRATGEPYLKLDIATVVARADEEALKLGRVEFAVLLWLAERAQRGSPGVDWSTAASADEFLAVAGRVLNPMGGEYERIERALQWRRSAAIRMARYFEPHKSRINKAIEEVLGPSAARRYAIQRSRATDSNVYYLPLEPRQIEITASEERP